MQKKPLVSVVMVGYNAKRFLKECIDSLIKGTYKNIAILYIDNGSTDGSVEYITSNYPQINLYRNSENRGFSAAHEGIHKKIKGDAMLLLNTDTVLDKRLLEELVKSLYQDQKIGAVQPKILMHSKKSKIDSIGSFFLMNGLLYHFGYGKDQHLDQYNKQMEIFSTKGAVMLIKTDVLHKVVLPKTKKYDESIFDMDYFTAYEDTDLSMRIWVAGYKILYIPKAFAFHVGGGAVNKMVRSLVIFHGEKNRLSTYLKNLSWEYLCIMLPQMIVMLQVQSFMYLIIRRRIDIALSIQKAIAWNLFNLPAILKKRRYIQTYMRATKDADFIPRLTRSVRFSYYYYLISGLEEYID